MNPNRQFPGWKRLAPGLVLGLLLMSCASPAFAYLDPSTGSMVVSAIVGIFASIALAVKTYWYRIKNLFKGKQRDAGSSAGTQTTDTTRHTSGKG